MAADSGTQRSAGEIVNQTEITKALGERLDAGTAVTIAWENNDASPALPYLQVEFVPVAPSDPTLAGGDAVYPGYMMVYVNSDRDAFATPALAIADAVAALFPYALTLTTASGKVVVTAPPRIMQAYRDGANWRTPVRVDYRAA